MSADTTKKPAPAPENEAQTARWAKYGSNVVLMVVLAIVLAGLITYIAQAHDWRVDTTAEGVNSLKPQTLNVLHGLDTDIKLVSLYTRIQPGNTTSDNPHPIDKAAFVSDLLDNYKRASGKISIEVIDPVAEKAKVDQLVTDLDARYGKEIKNYKAYVGEYVDKTYKQLAGLLAAEGEKVRNLPTDQLSGEQRDQIILVVFNNLQSRLPRLLEDNKDQVTRRLKDHHPEYKAITTSIQETLEDLSANDGKIVEIFDKFKTDSALPPPIRQYMTDSKPRLQEIKKIADEQTARISKLGELKVDELTRALNVPDPILVLGPNDWRILSESQVWPENSNVKAFSEGKVTPDFAGEQQITTAIVALTTPKKPKVVFLRPGGPPMTSPGFPPFVAGGPFSDWADRLRQYNFDVLEKDLSGQWAMQQQMQQQMPSAPEPGWEELNDAVWVVLDFQSMQGPQPFVPKLAEHLGHGGSAVILANPQGDNLDAVMRDWGVEIHPEAVAVHEQPPAPPSSSGRIDMFQELFRESFIWNLKNYGDADLARPLRNLESLMPALVVVKSHEMKGYTLKSLLPLPTAPQAPKSWGETDLNGLQNGNPPTFDPKTDIPAPIAAGAAVQKQGGGRLVVIGGAQFAMNRWFSFPDPDIAKNEGRFVARFPANSELAANSVFWCAHMDSMIALSPAALQVSRIADMSPVTLNFWRIGVLLVILPGAVLAGGLGMYLKRRD